MKPYNPIHLGNKIKKIIDFLDLDLTGLTVLTEAASGPYIVTPIIASMANAKKVIAFTSDSMYANSYDVIFHTHELEKQICENEVIEIYSFRDIDLFSRADIITNLGFVRPIDSNAISQMKPTAVIPFMCEGWEVRPGDIDFIECKRKGIPIAGTNEEFPGLNIFSYCGWLCIKMMIDAKIELPNAKILINSSDKFGLAIEKQLNSLGLNVHLIKSLKGISEHFLSHFEVIIIADYTSKHQIIGINGDISARDIALINPSISIIQFAGNCDIGELIRYGIDFYPKIQLSPHKMAMTLAELGVDPVIELHSAGLKVGELLARARKELNLNATESINLAIQSGLANHLQILEDSK